LYLETALSNDIVNDCSSLLAAFPSLASKGHFLLADGISLPLCIASGVEQIKSGFLEVDVSLMSSHLSKLSIDSCGVDELEQDARFESTSFKIYNSLNNLH